MEKNRMSTDKTNNPGNTANTGNSQDMKADMNGNKGKFETEKLKKTDTSAIPGAEEEDNIGNAASGAGLGGNKGTGTRSKKDFT